MKNTIGSNRCHHRYRRASTTSLEMYLNLEGLVEGGLDFPSDFYHPT
jgi:hypothetical protein